MKKILAMIIISCVMLVMTGCTANDYKKAEELYSSGNLEAAKEIYESLGDYEDSTQKLMACRYGLAAKQLEDGNYKEALNEFEALGDYEDSKDKISECKIASANDAIDQGNYESALFELEKISGTDGSEELINKCKYNIAAEKYENGDVTGALVLYAEITGYEDSKRIIADEMMKYAGKDFVELVTEGQNRYNSYMKTAARELLNLSYGSGGTWSPDSNNPDIVAMLKAKRDIVEMKNNYKNVFTKQVMDACNDKEIKEMNDAYLELAKTAEKTYNTQTLYGAIVNAVNGTYDNTLDKLSSDVDDYTLAYNALMGK